MTRQEEIAILRAKIAECDSIIWLIKDRHSVVNAIEFIQQRMQSLTQQLDSLLNR